MAKIILLLTTSFLLQGCSSDAVENKRHQEWEVSYVRVNLIYFQDPKSGVCFAMLEDPPHPFAVVDCDKVKSLLVK